MNGYGFTLADADLMALASGGLWWADERALIVSDLHLGKSERLARRGGTLLPPYDVQDTLDRLAADLDRTSARTVICLGDSFDDLDAAALDDQPRSWLLRMMAGRRWIWVAGNHDPAPVDLGGEHLGEVSLGGIASRHIARPGAVAEISGHYHPKVRLAGQSRRCVLTDGAKAILPAYGTYTGGLPVQDDALAALMGPGAMAIVVGRMVCAVPMPRQGGDRRSALS